MSVRPSIFLFVRHSNPSMSRRLIYFSNVCPLEESLKHICSMQCCSNIIEDDRLSGAVPQPIGLFLFCIEFDYCSVQESSN